MAASRHGWNFAHPDREQSSEAPICQCCHRQTQVGATLLTVSAGTVDHTALAFFPPPSSPVMSMEESISLEETNRIRISYGLKPLTDDKGPATDKEKEAEDNYAKQRQREAKERETKYVYIVIFYMRVLNGVSSLGLSRTALRSE